MQATDLFFAAFALFALICGTLVIVSPNPVNSAMFLVLTIASLAGLFVLLNAFFLAAVQVLVYAGAVMVLFLFVIMLLDLKDEQRRKIRKFSLALGGIAAAAVGLLLIRTIWFSGIGPATQPQLEAGTRPLGTALFQDFLLPFEIVSVILLVAMVGVVLLSKKELK
ncbi:MAG TPA: NADH-quinone oxidoreductase subunit J [Candidatus Binatia bacterium]|nr:NADH-quinone oxidoreductase subunit J [Candidatus Binatia bacterium]